MRSEKIGKAIIEKPYPKLLTSKQDQYTVLMVRSGCGTIVNINDDAISDMFFLGAYRDDWLEYAFTECNETIVLEN